MHATNLCNRLTLVQQLAKQYHPDTNKTAAAKERFVEIQNAYDVRFNLMRF